MLDLEVVPERSLGNEQWEFVLGTMLVFFCGKFILAIGRLKLALPVFLNNSRLS